MIGHAIFYLLLGGLGHFVWRVLRGMGLAQLRVRGDWCLNVQVGNDGSVTVRRGFCGDHQRCIVTSANGQAVTHMVVESLPDEEVPSA